MAFESIKAEIDLLLAQMNNQPEDVHQLVEAIHEKIALLRAEGLPVPDDLLELEKQLHEEYGA
jgi:hypothetical protein